MFSLDLCITDKCNHQCPHCYVNPTSIMDELTTQQIQNLLTECSDLGAQNFHVLGGEPFLRNDLEEIFDYAYDLKYSLSIATNGTTLESEDFSWLKRMNPFVGINFFGPQKFHDSFCQQAGAYEKALQTLKTGLEMNLNFGAITCITTQNQHLYFSWMQSLVAMGVQTFFIIYFSPLGRGKDHPEYQMSNVEWGNFYQTLKDYVLNSAKKVDIYFETSIVPKVYYPIYHRPPSLPCALFSKSNCVVDANGDVYPCILFLRNPEYLLGNFKINSLHEIWDRFQPGTRSVPDKCKNCEHIRICNGGCPAYLKNDIDFRCAPKYIPLCPLYPEIL